jgi:hypothetical protein
MGACEPMSTSEAEKHLQTYSIKYNENARRCCAASIGSKAFEVMDFKEVITCTARV